MPLLSTDRVVIPLRILLVALAAFMLLLQVMSFPGQFAHMAQEDPDFAPWRWPMTAFAIVELACCQVVVLATWKLLGMVREDQIFTDDAFRWVDAILVAMTTAWVLFAGLALVLGLSADDPGGPMLLFGFLLAGLVVILLMLVMRTLLRQATSLRTDMEGVI